MVQSFLNSFHKCAILGSVCTIGFVVVGFSKLFGLLFVASLERYGQSRKLTSIPFILPYTIKNLVGPLAGYLSSTFGQRSVIMTGSLMCSLAFTLSFFAEHIVYDIIFIGIFYGFAFGFTINMMPHALHQEFAKHIDKATGVLFGMASVGGFILLELTKTLLSFYGLSGTLLILSGVALHCIPAALLLKEKKTSKKIDSVINNNKTEVSLLEISRTGNKPIEYETKFDFSRKINVHCEEGYKFYDNAALSSSNATQSNTRDVSKPKDLVASSIAQSHQTGESPSVVHPNEATDASKLNKNSIAQSYQTGASPSVVHPNEATITSKLNKNVKPSVTHIFRVFLDTTFILIALVQGMSMFTMVVFWTVMLDASIDKGVSSEDGIQIIIAAAIAETIGRFLSGFVIASCNITKINFATFGYFVFGVLSLVFVYLRAFAMILIAVCLMQLLIGGLMTIQVGIVPLYVEKSHIRMAMASRYFFYTPLSICGPYIIGYFRDVLKTYDGLLYTQSVICFLSAALNAVTPAVARFRDKKKRKIDVK